MTTFKHSLWLSIAFVLAAFLALAGPAISAPAVQKQFPSAEEAAKAFIAACEQQDTAAMLALLGPDAGDIINSGDDAQDKLRRERFAALAKESTEIRPDPYNPNRFLLYVGNHHWPLPIPIVKAGDSYGFDPAVAKTEILARRVGHNELDAIAFLRGFVDAEIEYAYSDVDRNGVRDYAQSLVSVSGKQDGLYWQQEDGSVAGPGAEFAERFLSQGYDAPDPGQPLLYHGYIFKILKAQGPNAAGGARDYVVNDSMIGGFAMVAYPVEYAVSGVKTFLVNQDGTVWEKDLGTKTKALAEAMKSYNPDKTWKESPREEPEPTTTSAKP